MRIGIPVSDLFSSGCPRSLRPTESDDQQIFSGPHLIKRWDLSYPFGNSSEPMVGDGDDR